MRIWVQLILFDRIFRIHFGVLFFLHQIMNSNYRLSSLNSFLMEQNQYRLRSRELTYIRESKLSSAKGSSKLHGKPPIPKMIKRNTVFLAGSQANVAVIFQVVPTVASLIILRMTGSIAFVGAAVAILGLMRIFTSYPIGKVADRWGRRHALLLGMSFLPFGAILLFYSVTQNDITLFFLGIAFHGLGHSAVQQVRIAVSDMYPTARKAESVSYVLTGSIAGTIGAPLIIAYAVKFAEDTGLDPYSTPWLFMPFFALASIVLIIVVNPDPRKIAQNLKKYYLDYSPVNINKELINSKIKIRDFVTYYPIIVSLLVTSLTWGIMAMMMSLVSVILRAHGFDLTAISIAVSIHVLGMYALSIPIGRLADRFGRKKILMAGSAFSGIGAIITTASNEYWVVVTGIFLVGLGWSAAIVTSTAIISDVCHPGIRGRVLGVINMSTGVTSVMFPLAGGLIADSMGFFAIGVLGLIISFPSIFATFFLRETQPGIFKHKLHENISSN